MSDLISFTDTWSSFVSSLDSLITFNQRDAWGQVRQGIAQAGKKEAVLLIFKGKFKEQKGVKVHNDLVWMWCIRVQMSD